MPFTSANVEARGKAWHGHTGHTPATQTKVNNSSSVPRGQGVSSSLFIYLFGVWIGVYDFIVSPEMKEGGANSNCCLEPSLIDACVHMGLSVGKLRSAD